ncbi:MAG: aminotransferase class III-fold pyridoxal phosphate-dependent enzyme [Actinobacteria bacterium]|nr:MAG: aminotransferase class III-fold pyridoxal phosphate-dependent enzyme [Actinomycetota bacterium]
MASGHRLDRRRGWPRDAVRVPRRDPGGRRPVAGGVEGRDTAGARRALRSAPRIPRWDHARRCRRLAPPAAYVRALADRTHEVGALYVADEVQVGHGRGGEPLWSFAAMDVATDIVTMGKPMGNGHPVAAVVTRREIVERFAETTEWFSTFGGNPVACAAALAVLDVIEDEDLIARAGAVGSELRAAIRAVDAPAIGDVRGLGLLTGVEIVDASGDPDPARAAAVKNAMRGRGVLVGSTGPLDHVLKFRPPLVFGAEHIDRVVTALAQSFAS